MLYIIEFIDQIINNIIIYNIKYMADIYINIKGTEYNIKLNNHIE